MGVALEGALCANLPAGLAVSKDPAPQETRCLSCLWRSPPRAAVSRPNSLLVLVFPGRALGSCSRDNAAFPTSAWRVGVS